MLALIIILLLAFTVIYFFGAILAPVFLAIGLAYLLNFPLHWLIKKGLPRWAGLTIIFSLVALVLGFLVTEVVPLLIRQLRNLITELPSIITGLRSLLETAQLHLKPYIGEQYLYQIYENFYQLIQRTLDIRLDNIIALLSSVVYVSLNLFLVPFMALLILVDIKPLTEAITRYLPQSRELASGVFTEFLAQLDNYVKGKVAEFIIMTLLSFGAFLVFELKYNIIISLVIGISVIIPYVGIIVATVPLVVVAFFQFGLTNTFWALMVVHTILQIFNGNILVPYLYSKANNLRPFTILVAVLFFGQIWGVLGVFLAIPLATLIKAVANAWLLNSKLYQEALERELEQEKYHGDVEELVVVKKRKFNPDLNPQAQTEPAQKQTPETTQTQANS